MSASWNLPPGSSVTPKREWQCDLGGGKFDHDWAWVDDWYGDPGVIGGTQDCGFWRCRACGEEDYKRERPYS